jgi:iron-sulfur cluster assembly protein
MLNVPDFAAAAIRHLIERNNAPDGTGLRISQGSPGRPLKVSLARAPEPEDTVIVAADGARVFLDKAAASLLDDQILDVTLGVRGRVEFFTADARQSRGNVHPR